MLPPFNRDGMLPPGLYPMTVEQLRGSMLVVGPSEGCPNWDRDWRGHLVDNLGTLVRQLWAVGVTAIFVGGSFAEEEDRPRDIDGYFECEIADFVSREPEGLAQRLNRLDPHKS